MFGRFVWRRVGPGCFGVWAVLAFFVGAEVFGPAFGQTASRRRAIERLLDRVSGDGGGLMPRSVPGVTGEELLFVEGGLALSFGALSVDEEDETTEFVQAVARPSFRVGYAGVHELVGRLSLDFRKYEEGDDDTALSRSGRLSKPIVEELWYRLDFGEGVDRGWWGEGVLGSLALTVGRRDTAIGTGLVLDRSLVVGEVEASVGFAEVRLFGGVTPSDSTIDFDASRPGFDSSVHRWFVGGEVWFDAGGGVRPFVYGLAQIDANTEDEAVVDVGGVPTLTEFGYDSRYVGGGFEATVGERWVVSAEGVYEFGESVSNPFDYGTGLAIDPTRDEISAWAGTATVTRLFRDAGRSSVVAQVVVGSGDEDRISSNQTVGGNASGTTDRAFNGFGVVPLGFVLAPEPSNLVVGRVAGRTGVDVGLSRMVEIGVDGYVYGKLNSEAGTSFATVEGERFVGVGFDAFVSWPLRHDVRVDVQYGVFVPGEAIPEGDDGLRDLVYVGVTYVF